MALHAAMCLEERKVRQGDKDFTISRWATFADKQVEEEYFNYDVFQSLTIVRRIVLICGLLFFLVAAYDIVYYNFDPAHYLHSVVSRAIGLVLAIAFYLCAPKIKNARAITAFLTVFELSIILGYIYILYSQKAQGYTEQAMTIMLMIFCIFMFPNRWHSLLLTSVLTVVLFLFAGPYYVTNLSNSLRVELAIVLVATIILASAFYYRQNISRRKQYAESNMRMMLSYTDRLTNIYNRSKFDDELAAWCTKAAEGQAQFSVILIDIDHFKSVNDNYGHIVGDEVLVNMTLAISANIRTEDIFARWGGEEFVILQIDGSAGTEAAAELANRLQKAIENKRFDTVGQVTISLGVVAYEHGDTPITIMQRADRAMYESKAKGRNAVSVL